jgi:hypothetical protein
LNSDPIGELVREVAAKHQIAVGRNDPIWVLHTLNEHLLRDTARAQDEMLVRLKEELELLAHHWDKTAKAKAERILNASLDAAKQTLEQSAERCSKTVEAAVRQELNKARAWLDAPAVEARRIALLNLTAAALAVVASGLAVWACKMAMG